MQAIHEEKKAQIWSRENIEASQEIYRKDIMRGIYGIEVNMTKLIKEYMIEQVFIYVKKLLFLKDIHVCMYYQVFQGICVWFPNLSKKFIRWKTLFIFSMCRTRTKSHL